jgi:hypothetical protein
MGLIFIILILLILFGGIRGEWGGGINGGLGLLLLIILILVLMGHVPVIWY